MRDSTDTLSGNRVKRPRVHFTVLVLLFAWLGTATSCTTSIRGDTFVNDSQVAEQYSFKVYVGGLQFLPPDGRAVKRIKEFMKGKAYASYEIVGRRYNWALSCWDYAVRFVKAPCSNESATQTR